MGRSASSAMATKAIAMYGHHLKEADYVELLRKNTVQEIAGYLKAETAFRSSLKGIAKNTINRGFLETLVRQEFYIDFIKLIRYGDPAKKDFYRFGIVQIEIKQILVAIRAFKEHDRSNQLAQLPLFAKKMMSFELEKLVKVFSFDDLLNVLKNTDYYRILLPLKPVIGNEEIDYVACELALKNHFFDLMNQLIENKFSGKDKQLLKDVFNSRIELEHLTYIYRLKKYFQLKPNEIKEYINPVSVHIPKKKIMHWVETGEAADILDLLKNSYYHIEFDLQDLGHIENLVDRVQFKQNKKMLRHTGNAEIVLIAYMNLLEVQIQNIIDIVEGVRYHINRDRLSKILIY